ncbi:hypothetical protein GCM10022286_02960 [Gryllotalpicola daejeonensis]|uniref:ABM domain-containing protein n=1 Tax=Gryllotalpicola daejeonensis TaxID=993087 RepID=A0ABP7ZDX2_9MICO
MSALMLINKLTVKPGKRDEVTAILLESGKAFDGIDGCVMSLVTHDADDADVLWVQDVWADEAAHEAAMAEPQMREYVQKCVPLLSGMPEQHRVLAVGGKTPKGLGL